MTAMSVSIFLKDRALLAGTALALAVLSAIGWFAFADGEPDDKKSAKQRYAYMHCSRCEDEVPFTAAGDGKTCERCGKGTYTPTATSIKKGAGSERRGTGKIALLAMLALLVLQGWAYLYVVRARAHRKAIEVEEKRTLINACPYCGRKVQFPIARLGTGIICAQCKTGFMLSAVEPTEARNSLTAN